MQIALVLYYIANTVKRGLETVSEFKTEFFSLKIVNGRNSCECVIFTTRGFRGLSCARSNERCYLKKHVHPIIRGYVVLEE